VAGEHYPRQAEDLEAAAALQLNDLRSEHTLGSSSEETLD